MHCAKKAVDSDCLKRSLLDGYYSMTIGPLAQVTFAHIVGQIGRALLLSRENVLSIVQRKCHPCHKRSCTIYDPFAAQMRYSRP